MDREGVGRGRAEWVRRADREGRGAGGERREKREGEVREW